MRAAPLFQGLTGAIAAVFLSIAPLAAQPAPGGPPGWEPGMMMGPGMMGGPRFMGRYSEMCSPRAAGLAEWRIDRIERALKPNEAQRAALDELRNASKKAAEIIAAACPREIPQTATGRLEFMEKRLEAMLQAVKTVRPAFEAFYATLNAEQKQRLDAIGPRRWGWRHWRLFGREEER